MPTKASVLYNLKAGVDPGEFFERYYRDHVPLVRQIPGIKRFVLNRAVSPQAEMPFTVCADLYFEDGEALDKALESPEVQAAVEDIQGMVTDLTVLRLQPEEIF